MKISEKLYLNYSFLFYTMNMNTKIIYIILIAFSIVGFTWWWVAQNKVNNAERIIEIDREIVQLNNEIALHQSWYKISMQASEECSQSFINDANKEHIAADKKREKMRILENEKAGLIKNR